MKKKRGRTKKPVEKKPKTLEKIGEEAFLNFVDQNAREKSASDHAHGNGLAANDIGIDVNFKGFAQFSSASDSGSSSSSSSGESNHKIQLGNISSDSDEPQIGKRVKRTATKRGGAKGRETSKKTVNAGVSSSKVLGSSSRKELPPPKNPVQDSRLKRKELKASLAVVQKVMEMDEAVPFNAPVDPVSQRLPDYFNIIDKPMDFGTICSNLQKGVKYMNSEDVYKDVEYIWDNCVKYNKKGDYIVYLMKRVEKKFMKNWKAAGLRGEKTKKPNGFSQFPPSSDHTMEYGRHDPLCTVDRLVNYSIHMQPNNFGTGHTQPLFPLSSYAQTHHYDQPQPSNNQVPQYSHFQAGVDSSYADINMNRGRGRGSFRGQGRATSSSGRGIHHWGRRSTNILPQNELNVEIAAPSSSQGTNPDQQVSGRATAAANGLSGPTTRKPAIRQDDSSKSSDEEVNARWITVTNGMLDPSSKCARRITKIFKMKQDPQGYTWKCVTIETKIFYWEEFQKHFDWAEDMTTQIKDAWEIKAANRYKNFLSDMRGKEKPQFVSDIVWEAWQISWSDPKYQAMCTQYSKNRRSEIGGEGAGISRHTGGSKSTIEHARYLKKKYKRTPLPIEVFKHMHTRNNDGETFVDKRSQSIAENYESLKKQLVDEQSEPGVLPCIDETEIYLDVVGGVKKGYVYGIGSQSSFYLNRYAASSSSATSPAPDSLPVDNTTREMQSRIDKQEEEIQLLKKMIYQLLPQQATSTAVNQNNDNSMSKEDAEPTSHDESL